MRSLMINKTNELVFEDIAEPTIQNPDDIKIKMAYSSICGYEIMVLEGKGERPPGIIGHEASGVITELGDNAKKYFNIGDHVAMNNQVPCGQCISCRRGKSSYCDNIFYEPGSVSEYTVRKMDQVWKLPLDCSIKIGCLAEPLSICLVAVNKVNIVSPRTIVILGGGAMGLMTLLLAQRLCCRDIVVVEPNEEKQRLALELGASSVLSPNDPDVFSHLIDYSNGYGFDAVIEASGNRDSAKLAMQIPARGGMVSYLSMFEQDFELPVNLLNLYSKDLLISSVFPTFDTFEKAVYYLPQLPLKKVITAVYPFDRAIEAYYEKLNNPKHAKVLIEF